LTPFASTIANKEEEKKSLDSVQQGGSIKEDFKEDEVIQELHE